MYHNVGNMFGNVFMPKIALAGHVITIIGIDDDETNWSQILRLGRYKVGRYRFSEASRNFHGRFLNDPLNRAELRRATRSQFDFLG